MYILKCIENTDWLTINQPKDILHIHVLTCIENTDWLTIKST